MTTPVCLTPSPDRDFHENGEIQVKCGGHFLSSIFGKITTVWKLLKIFYLLKIEN